MVRAGVKRATDEHGAPGGMSINSAIAYTLSTGDAAGRFQLPASSFAHGASPADASAACRGAHSLGGASESRDHERVPRWHRRVNSRRSSNSR